MSGSVINPITAYAVSDTAPLCFLMVEPIRRKLDLEIRSFVQSNIKYLSWANVRLCDLKSPNGERKPMAIKDAMVVDEIADIREFYQTLIDLYECGLTLCILNAMHETCTTINMGLVNTLQEQCRVWVMRAKELAGEDQFRLRALLHITKTIETLEHYHESGIKDQMANMSPCDQIVSIWVDLKTRRIIYGQSQDAPVPVS